MKGCFLALSLGCVALVSACNPPRPPARPVTLVPYGTVEYLWKNPEATPAFFAGVKTHLNPNGRRVIEVGFNTAFIWEPRQVEDVAGQIQRTTIITVDGVEIETITYSQVAIRVGHYDSEGNYLGSHGGTVIAEFDSTYLTSGLHWMTVETFTASGKSYFHALPFEIP